MRKMIKKMKRWLKNSVSRKKRAKKTKLFYVIMINPMYLSDKVYYYFVSEEKLEAFRDESLDYMKKVGRIKLTKKDLMIRSGFFEYDVAERYLQNTSEQIVAWRHPGEMYVEHTDYYYNYYPFDDPEDDDELL